MKLLAIDTCLSSASVAVLSEEKLWGQYYIDNKLTHSTKLIPMIENILSELDITMKDIDALAVTNGPGSFTGIRIGMATAKGLALPQEKPIMPISSLEAGAYNFQMQPLPVCVMTDARNSQVFYGKYIFDNGNINELKSPTAVAVEDLSLEAPTIVMGDGAVKYKDILSKNENVIFAPPQLNMPNAAGLGAAAFYKIKTTGFPASETLDALYVRKSSAEQEKERKNKK